MYELIRKDWIESRKSGDKFKAEKLGLIISEVKLKESSLELSKEEKKLLEKDGKRDIDAITEYVIKQGIKNLRELVQVKQKCESYDEERELTILLQYVTTGPQLNEIELSEVIDAIITENNASSMKDMKIVMSELKDKYDGRYDPKLAGPLAKQKLIG